MSLAYFFMKANKMTEVELKLEEESKDSSFKQIFVSFAHEADYLFWMLIFIDTSVFMIFRGMVSELNEITVTALSVDTEVASYYVLYYEILLGFFQVLSGYLASKLANYIFALLIGTILNIMGFALLLVYIENTTEFAFMLSLTILAWGYSFSANFMFSGLSLVVSSKYHGIGYGILQCCVNLSILSGSIIYGALRDLANESYYIDYYFSIFMEVGTFLLAIIMWYLDHRKKKVFDFKKE